MTVVGSVEVTVEALVNQGVIAKQIGDQLQKPVTDAGKSAGKTMGKHVGESAAAELEKSGARFARSGRLLANVFTSNSAAALGPLQEVADKVELIGTSLERTRTKAGGALLGIGAAATGIGAFLSTLQSREQGAMNRLAASIAATGGDISTYRDEIEKAVKSGEKFGQSGNQTIDALQALTIGLHDPKKALEELHLAEDIAAAKQISLNSAANLVRQAYNGNTRVLKAFGIQVSGIIDGQKLLKDAHDQTSKASDAASKAQKDYTDKLAIYKDTLKPTLSQQIALKNSHDKLLKAQDDQRVAQEHLTTAQAAANKAGSKGQEVLDKLSQITAGQATASADTFTGRLKAYGAAIENNAAKTGGWLGGTLIKVGPALAGIGFIIESGLIPKLGKAALTFLHLRDVEVVTSAEGALAVEGAAAAEVVAVDTVAVAAEGTAVRVRASFIAMLGPMALVVGAAAAVKESIDMIRGAKAEGAAFATASSQIVDALKAGQITKSQADALIKQALLHPEKALDLPTYLPASGNIGPDAAETSFLNQRPGRNNVAAAAAAAAAAAKAKAAGSGTQSLDDFLKSMGLGPTASNALDKALSDAQKAAGDRAKKIGAEVTAGIKAQVTTVKTEIAGLNKELKAISDLRGQVVGQASSFASVTGLLPDNSLATSGALVRGLQTRAAAEALFGKNITSLAARHLDKSVITEILKQGPDQARSIAAALALGPDSDIAKLNLAQKAASQQAQVLGSEAVAAQFGAGTQARANAELARANAQLAVLNKQIAAQPALIAKAVQQAQHNAKVTTTTNTRTAVPR